MQTNSRVKYLNTLDLTNNNNEITSVDSPKKNVTWGKNDEIVSNVDSDYTANNDVEENIFKKLKRVGNTDNIKLELNENIRENRITKLEVELTNLHKKMDFIIDLLKQDK